MSTVRTHFAPNLDEIQKISCFFSPSVLSAVASGCGGPKVLNGTGGSLSSLGYPGSYSNRARCQWIIQAPPGKLVHLRFHNFSLEESELCVNDKVSLSDRLGSLGT